MAHCHLLDTVAGTKLGIEFLKCLNVAGLPSVDSFLDRADFLILPVKRIKSLADNFGFGSALNGCHPFLNAFNNILRKLDMHFKVRHTQFAPNQCELRVTT